jgi:hypothetical protein
MNFFGTSLFVLSYKLSVLPELGNQITSRKISSRED